jgi:hypothetical protein
MSTVSNPSLGGRAKLSQTMELNIKEDKPGGLDGLRGFGMI